MHVHANSPCPGIFSMLMVLKKHLSLKLNKAPALAVKDDPTAPSVALVGTPRPRLCFTGWWIDIQRRVFGGIAFNRER